MKPGTATVTLSAPDPAVTVVARPIVVTVGSAAPIDLDGVGGPVTFPCNEGDTGTVTAQDVSAGGVKSEVATYSFTATDTTTVPATPGISFSFVVNPSAPAPAPAAS